eukprot:6257965-Alexandrium_andersonii.AAC.1
MSAARPPTRRVLCSRAAQLRERSEPPCARRARRLGRRRWQRETRGSECCRPEHSTFVRAQEGRRGAG